MTSVAKLTATRRAMLLLSVAWVSAALANAQTDPLPSWNDGAAKNAIVAFVQTTTTQDSPKFVPLEVSIATFDEKVLYAKAKKRGWIVVSMQKDWKQIFSFEK